MRIAIDARLVGGTNTGDSTYWTCLVDAFSREFPQHQLLLFSNRHAPKSVPSRPNIRWIHLGGEGPLWSLARLPMAARREKADLLHVQYSLSPLAKNGVTTIHDVSFFIGPEWFSARQRSTLHRTIPLAARSAKRIITVSHTSAREIESFVPNAHGKVRVALNACPPWIQRVNDPQPNLRELGIDSPYVLTVGTRWARKNQELARAAVEALPEDLGVKLVVTGKSTDGLAGPRIKPVGYVSEADLCALYSAASVYLAPSLHEGFGVPLLEAMRCGAPVLCGPGGAMPEVANGAAVIASDYEVESWSRELTALLSDQSKLDTLRTKGFAREKEFTWEQSARSHARIYEEACQS